MAQLGLTYDDLMSATGDFLGFGFDSSTYSAASTNTCDRIVQSALRKFYYWRGLVDGNSFTGWSFMNPTATLTLVAGTQVYDLADDFADTDGPFEYAAGLTLPPVQIVDEANIRNMYAMRNLSGDPLYACISAQTSDGTAQQTCQVEFFPAPNAARVLTYRYYVNPLQLTGGAAYPLGGPMVAECLKEGCLAEAEKYSDDTIGLHSKIYDDLLQTTARADMMATTPEFLGRNIDRSDNRYPIVWG